MKHSEKIRQRILEAGIKIWHGDPMKVTARNIAKSIDMVHATILYHFGEKGIRNAVAEYAVQIGDEKIIVQLISNGHPSVSNLPNSKKNKFLKQMCNNEQI